MNTGNEMDEGDLPIVTRFYLYLSGTPFRALNSGEFIEEQIYNWTYSDVQSAKETWPSEHPGKPNPYEALPRMVILTYQMPDEIRKVDENAGPEEKVSEFINFLSVLAYDGSAMRPVSATDILDIAMAGTPATLLARRWESAPTREHGERHPAAHHGQRGRHAGAHEHQGLPKPQRGHRDHHYPEFPAPP